MFIEVYSIPTKFQQTLNLSAFIITESLLFASNNYKTTNLKPEVLHNETRTFLSNTRTQCVQVATSHLHNS